MEAAVQESGASVVTTTVYSQIELVLEKEVDRNDALRLQELGFDSLRTVTLMTNLSDELGVDMFDFSEEDLRLEPIADLIRRLSKHVKQN